jgi:hypothetical protein
MNTPGVWTVLQADLVWSLASIAVALAVGLVRVQLARRRSKASAGPRPFDRSWRAWQMRAATRKRQRRPRSIGTVTK